MRLDLKLQELLKVEMLGVVKLEEGLVKMEEVLKVEEELKLEG